ncbi:MAG: lipid-A-disaccharide synthase [Rhizobiaceae bacterium]
MGKDSRPPVRVYFVIGEESGDALGADLIDGMQEIGLQAEFCGLAGRRMQAKGIHSLFDISDIAVMGFSAVFSRLPTILSRINQAANDIIEKKPDVLVLIDSPDFTHRVARKVRKKNPDILILKYVCPSVWAWRPGRAPTMKGYVDHVLTILPFEPGLLAELDGPPATYVGHPLYAEIGNRPQKEAPKKREKVLLLLPGSRRIEIKLLLPDMEKTLEILEERGNKFRAIMPVVPHLKVEISAAVSRWKTRPEIVDTEEEKLAAFEHADAALAASGTVLLELALFRVPMISIYRLDWLIHQFRFLIFGWSAALPNLILDETLIPERVGDMIRPGWLARALETLMKDSPERKLQMDGFERLVKEMARDKPPGVEAAKKIKELLS